ncbi:MAG TPA: hypothetical protein VGX16_06315 [Solirubrobacteraceae bacterium]|jgi:mono/diheme cytochrome c family protein|nr:hypothetical protein [Solirubrobacteraceae bacterium]
MAVGFVLIWVILGLGVFFVAMRGGPRGAREALHVESRAGRRLVTAGVLVLLAFGLVVPALVMTRNGESRASVGVGGVHLNAEEQHGRYLFSQSCGVCHTLAATRSVGRIGPNLDVLLPEKSLTVAGRRALVLSAIAEGRARGLGQMPALLYRGHDAESIADFLATVAGH